MSDFFPNPTAVLKREGTEVEGAVVDEVAWEVDEGWSWKATVQGDAIDPWESVDTAYKVEFTDGLGNSQETPDLVSLEPEYSDPDGQTDPDTTFLGGTCKAIFNLRKSNQSFPSFIQSDAETILAALGTRAGVTITGAPTDLYVGEEDVKNAKLADALARFLDVAAFEFAVTTAGAVACQAWETSAGDLVFDWSDRRVKVDKRNLFTGIRLGKESSMDSTGEQVFTYDSVGPKNTTLSPELTGPVGSVETTAEDGYLLWICFFNAADEYTAYQDYTFGSYPEGDLVVPAGTGPAVRFTCQVAISGPGQVACRVRVNGTPPDTHPEGVDVEFLSPAVNTDGFDGEDTSLGSWPYESDFVDQLFPSQAYAEERRPHILSRLNADADVLTLTGPLQCGAAIQLFLRHVFRTREYKVRKIVWNFANNETTIELVRVVTETLS